MPTSLNHAYIPRRWLGGTVAALCFMVLPAQALALQLSNLVGVQEIGKPIDLKSTISGIPDGALSQLRSTCLKARLRSIETSGSSAWSDGGGDLVVDFQPTIRQGGLIEFKSARKINDALVELELVSECPLVAFSNTWTLIMAESQPVPVSSSNRRALPDVEPGSFDVRNSALLQASRQAPKRVVYAKASSPKDVLASQAEPVVEKAVVNNPPETPPQPAVVEQPVKLASLDPEFLNNGLIESRSEPQGFPVGLGLGGSDESSIGGQSDSFGLNSMALWIFGISLSLLVLLLAGFARYKWAGRGNFRVEIPRRAPVIEPQKASITEFRETTGFDSDEEVVDSPSSTFSSVATSYASDRVLESLMGSDETAFADMLSSSPVPMQSDLLENGNKSSLKITLELINRADIRGWKLPASYQSLVEQRNKSLELHRTPDALLLRCHIGLVELTFQDAKQGNPIQSETAQELLQLVLGESIYDVDANTTLCVPDVVKSHVRAKMCEIDGADKRQLLRENLIALNSQVLGPGLCFNTNEWREFLSEEGMLD